MPSKRTVETLGVEKQEEGRTDMKRTVETLRLRLVLLCPLLSADLLWCESEERRGAYLPAGQLCVLGCGAAVVTSKFVFGLLEQGVQAVLQRTSAASRSGLWAHQVLQAAGQQRLLHVGVPAAVHLGDLEGKAAQV